MTKTITFNELKELKIRYLAEVHNASPMSWD